MSKLFEALNAVQAKTANGAITNETSGNANVDLFFIAGASRGKNIAGPFVKAYQENPEYALRILQWLRDARGGAGERQLFIELMKETIRLNLDAASAILTKTPELGRWKDVLAFEGTALEKQAFDMIAVALAADDGLCAKWLPRKGKTAARLRKHFGLTAKEYRKLIVSMSNTVEQAMCAKRWEDIDFNKIPSLAAARYQKAFMGNCKERYEAYVESLEKGEADVKINAGAVYPYDIVKSVGYGESRVADQQWKALPDYMEGTEERILPVVDVSGSMGCAAGGNNSLSCMDVAISLGIYISERNEGTFKDEFMTFSQRPQLHKLTGTLSSRVKQLRGADWGYNTNLQAVFDTLLTKAKRHGLAQTDMPSKILILSDMQFDTAVSNNSATNHEAIRNKYKQAGYDLPQLVFWNLNATVGNSPVTVRDAGTALISGFSPAIMGSVLGTNDLNPLSVMESTIMVPRYDL